jgi:hypothetical protein
VALHECGGSKWGNSNYAKEMLIYYIWQFGRKDRDKIYTTEKIQIPEDI